MERVAKRSGKEERFRKDRDEERVIRTNKYETIPFRDGVLIKHTDKQGKVYFTDAGGLWLSLKAPAFTPIKEGRAKGMIAAFYREDEENARKFRM